MYGAFLKWEIPKSPWVSILFSSNDWTIWGYPHFTEPRNKIPYDSGAKRQACLVPKKVSDFLASQVPGSLLLIIGSGVAGWDVLQKISKNGAIAVDIAGLLAIA